MALDPETDRRGPDRDSSLGDIIDAAVRRLSTSIAIAGALIALAIYARPGPPSFEAFPTDGGIVRVNTRSGTVLQCNEAGRCGIVVRKGQRLDRHPPPKALPSPAAAPAPASVPTVIAPSAPPAAAPAPKQAAPAG